ncbi:sigma-E factor negative regulatory protein [Schlegelella sp. S2-27]|uniref:Sigma-E factor negative regulatory protein n=1 Tax=Caldimonas mangrovi TaxID=2944811 RepID=A0ABT0YQ40_9BURK|nr:sigma-E factor negative regulatory protein [Caldimonas mangrovi]MCM5680858.1 sigma-E factor negative regulatory protein [Caldimonas mangrovi]
MSTERWSDSGFSVQARQRLSALCDGEVEADDLHSVLAAWRDPSERMATCEVWHAYQLIGDVMRSDDLAGRGRDGEFLSRLRERLTEEPVVMAPSATPGEAAGPAVLVGNGGAATRARRRSWTAPVATAAGVMAVAGVLVVTRLSDPSVLPGAGATLVQAPAAATVAAASAVPAPRPAGAEQIVVTANGPLLRDARLEQYLAAHKQFGGSSALGVPSGFLRGATYEGPTR